MPIEVNGSLGDDEWSHRVDKYPSIAPIKNVVKPQMKMCSVMAGLVQRVYVTRDVIRGKKSERTCEVKTDGRPCMWAD